MSGIVVSWTEADLRARYPRVAAEQFDRQAEKSEAGRMSPKKSRWSAATPQFCAPGHRHASKMEAGVCERLTRECVETGLVLLQQLPMPLLILRDAKGCLPRPLRVDFGIYDPVAGKLVRLVEAKSRRVSRDWPARRRAWELSWGLTIEEVS